MRNVEAMILAVVAVALSTTACATVDRAPFTLLSPTVTVVAGVSMLDPMRAASVTYDAVQVEPQHAALIAAFAVAAAPDYANAIIVAATNGAPEFAADINGAAKRALRLRPTPRMTRAPDPNDLARMIDRASVAAER